MKGIAVLVALTLAAVTLPWPFTLCIVVFVLLLAGGYTSPDRPAPEVQAELDYRRGLRP